MNRALLHCAALALALLAACASDENPLVPDGGGTPDAAPAPSPDAPPPSPDAPPAPTLRRLDWREQRWEPFAATTHELAVDSVVAVHEDGFVAREYGCADDQPCAHTWYDLDATALRTRPRLMAVNRGIASPSARRLALLEHDGDASCDQGELAPAALGTLKLLDVASGESLRDIEDYRADRFSPGAFASEAWMSLWYVPPGTCGPMQVRYQAAAPPFDTIGADYLEVALPGGGFTAWRRSVYGVQRDLREHGSFVALGESPSAALGDDASGWVHATFGYAFNVYEIRSVLPGGARRTTAVDPEGGWLGLGAQASGRWVRLCRDGIAEEQRLDCLVVDTLGEHAPSQVTVATPVDTVLVGGAATLLYVGYDDDRQRVLLARDLVAGTTTTLAAAASLRMFATADGAAALALSENRLLLVDATGATELAGDVVQVYGMTPELGSALLPQSRVIFIVSAHAAGHTLHALDLATRRLVTLTDRLWYAPHLGRELLEDDCGQPAYVRSAGFAHEVLRQTTRRFFFVEAATATGAATMFLVPIELNRPPSRLATLPASPATCRPPLASPDGHRVVLVDHALPGQPQVTVGTAAAP
jgi:hypothetical protein